MDFSSLIQPVAPVQPAGPQQPGAMMPPGEGKGAEASLCLLMAQAIFSKTPMKRMMKDLIAQHRVRHQGGAKEMAQQHTAISLKANSGTGMGKGAFSSGYGQGEATAFRAQREVATPRQGEAASKEKASTNQSTDKFSAFAHKLSLREVKERVSEAFAQYNASKESAQLPRAPFGMMLDRRELPQDEKRTEKVAVERPEDKEKIKDKERLKREDKEKIEDDPNRKEVGRSQAKEFQPPPPQYLEKLTPQIFLGLELSRDVAESVTSSAAFQSAKAVLLVQGLSEKLVISHILQLFGGLKKQVYIWALGSEASFSDAWVFMRRLGMPCVTLMDFELGREDGGWNRIKFLLRKILAMEGGQLGDLNDEFIAELPHWNDSVKGMDPWLSLLERNGIFMAGPLDFDHLLLQAFPEAYGVVGLSSKQKNVLWQQILDVDPQPLQGYTEMGLALLPKYRELFCLENRLVTHQEALHRMDSFDIVRLMPDVLSNLLKRLTLLVAKKV